MDPALSFNSGFKAFASDESLSTFVKDQMGSIEMGWEVKPSFICGNNNMGNLFQNEINIENQVFGDMGFPPIMKNPQENVSSCGIGQSKARQSEDLFDLKLGGLIDQNGHNLSPSEIPIPSKRQRERGTGFLTPFCKVLGCNKDLSSCKDYHKRHKVCEIHSKTPKVIVNGIEQRFCQQCSRFHLLREFDDGKRSCRKRLAGHNERRRKPHGRLVPSYNIAFQGNDFNGSTRTISSYVIPKNLHTPYPQKFDMNDKKVLNRQSTSCITDEQMHLHSLPVCNFKPNPGIINGFIRASTSSSESAHSLLSSQSWTTPCQYEPSRDYIQLHPHDLNPILGFEGTLVNLRSHGLSQGSKNMTYEDRVIPDDGCTIDLLQLSSQLERVEHQKRNSRVNPANGVYVGLSITSGQPKYCMQ
uniref:squamosa promoter-binding-like protein 6 n=1 Tax=Erigeron canadensis TaxID=72917 RepID=UPI001CB93F55|nr:squamosa promoter-binding-like protein 6 [Erigeron canadensis]